MKFIIRDDDINYHFSAEQLFKWYDGIVEICPVSVCVSAFVKGDFFKWARIFENHLPYDIDEWRKDNTIYPIGDNKELVSFLKGLQEKQRIGISMHGVYHRNDELDIGEVKRNFIRGAEYYTNRDYTQVLSEAKDYLSKLFDIDVCSFSPPQNMINLNGLQAIINNNLSICVDAFSYRKVAHFLEAFGFFNTVRLYFYRLFYHRLYPYTFNHKIGFVLHKRLQPGLNIDDIKREFEFAYRKNGVFVLSTHSYGFDMKMDYYDMTMKDALLDVLHFSQSFDGVEYTTLHDLFKNQ